MRKVNGKIGYCDNSHLNISRAGGHYVYIRKVNNNGTCDVNVVTSLEDRNHNITPNKIRQVKLGNTYPIPKKDASFTRWSGINKTPIRNVKLSDIQDIGYKKIRNRHKFIVGKYYK